jgi:hypothetical protein
MLGAAGPAGFVQTRVVVALVMSPMQKARLCGLFVLGSSGAVQVSHVLVFEM